MEEKQSRREFLLTGALALAGAGVLANGPKPRKKPSYHLPLQLYSVRDEMKKDPLGTLKALRAMGYTEAEPATYMSDENYQKRIMYGYSSKELRKIMDDLGMKVPSSHVVFQKRHINPDGKTVSDEWKNVMEDANILGQKYVISPWFAWDKTNLDDCRRGFEVYNRAGEACKAAGLRFGFHNHHQEFTQKFGDDYLYDLMCREMDINYVVQQLDICNMSIAKVDPMRWLKMFPKNFELIHVKDRDKNSEESTTLGDGALNMSEILNYARKNCPVKYWVLEQESYGSKTPLECVKIDLDRMKSQFRFS
jgi:sugar phosphate isomerase/epimerase